MSRLIANLPDRSVVEFDSGSFDDWCVYLFRPNQQRYAPKDTEYFTALKNLAVIFGADKIYADFVKIYTPTTAVIDESVTDLIVQMAGFYNEHKDDICVWFTVIYAGMVAEENKKFAILKKRIKRLGIHQVLIENIDPFVAANFSKGKPWRELDVICKVRGF